MANKMYWAARCKKCRGMVGFRVVLYTVDALGLRLPSDRDVGTYFFGFALLENREASPAWQKTLLGRTDRVRS